MTGSISVCGVDCTSCPEFNVQCKGCNAIAGKVFWAGFMGMEVCPMYSCCTTDKKLDHCGHCSELPCKIYFDTRDPATTEEQHLEGIDKRVNTLKNLK